MEWENCYWLFDYYTGEIPALEPKKRLIVFASHKHGDHFNPKIFHLAEQYPDVWYVLSSDIRIAKANAEKYGVKEEIMDKIISVKPHRDYELQDGENNSIQLQALKSTDCGVAFLMSYRGKTIYHAGDLNHWIWKEETKQSNNDMTAKFNMEMEILKDKSIDIAFAPLDPRQEEWYYLGLEKLLNTAKVSRVYPMHFWGKPEIIDKFKQERGMYLNGAEVVEVIYPGQSWTVNS
jgi:L-ascorbate metabolism protein UlaG (beta-lactamase superfamily)